MIEGHPVWVAARNMRIGICSSLKLRRHLSDRTAANHWPCWSDSAWSSMWRTLAGSVMGELRPPGPSAPQHASASSRQRVAQLTHGPNWRKRYPRWPDCDWACSAAGIDGKMIPTPGRIIRTLPETVDFPGELSSSSWTWCCHSLMPISGDNWSTYSRRWVSSWHNSRGQPEVRLRHFVAGSFYSISRMPRILIPALIGRNRLSWTQLFHIVLEQLAFLGDTRSRRELLVFAQANPSRLPLTMGILQPEIPVRRIASERKQSSMTRSSAFFAVSWHRRQ